MQRYSATVHNEDAEIAYDVEGQGPLLLLVVGGNGDSRRFAALSAQLSDRYTVVRYDRRANFRSTGDTGAELDMAQQGRDAAAVIRALGNEPAFVFGNSAGAKVPRGFSSDYIHAGVKPPRRRNLSQDDMFNALVKLQSRSEEIFGKKPI
ncbi:alpha/beta fold hydrolase [Serratia proteamaculans]|uniref:alpha/beta fold hydrolase n=1 Tax=Serratia proteamaculans TaxID=28151 RepID=UPI00210A4A6E|nr:alpha/beta hydrolase [Serratia proteamaculans]